MSSEDTGNKVLAYQTVILPVDDLSKLKTSIRATPIGPRYPEGDPDHDPTPLYHIAVVLEEES